jgi:uncharacterized protein (TIGR03435 family)
MTLLADKLGNFAADRPAVDETGIKGNVDYSLEFRSPAANVTSAQSPDPDDSAPSFNDAVKEQLGIRMVPTKAPVKFFVVDHIEHPAPN